MAKKKTSSEPLPHALQDLAKVDLLWDVKDGVDLELKDRLSTEAEAADDLRAWTGQAATGPVPFRFFGQDGTGSLYGFWLLRTEAPLGEQPVVFLGSEGELGVVSRDLPDFVVLLSRRVPAYEVVSKTEKFAERPMPGIRAVAERHFPQALSRTTDAIVAEARALNKALKVVLPLPE